MGRDERRSMVMALPVLFLDHGGVMSDGQRRTAQWYPLVAEFFPPQLGGTPEAWMEANRIVAARFRGDDVLALWEISEQRYAEFNRRYSVAWLSGMCELVGVPCPDEAATIELTYHAERYITARVRAAF